MVSKFVGQRVRLVRPHFPSNFGIEGRIWAICYLPIGRPIPGDGRLAGMDSDCVVAWDDGDNAPQLLSQLEPILPEGAQPSEFSFTELMDNLGVVLA